MLEVTIVYDVEESDVELELDELVEFELVTYADGWYCEMNLAYDPEWDEVAYEMCIERDGE